MNKILSIINMIVPYLSGTSGLTALVFLFFTARAKVRRALRRLLLISVIILVLWLIFSPASPIQVSLK